jgi:hypothetical protein
MLIGQRHRFVTDFAETLYRDNRAPLHLVIDEADEFCPQNQMPETKRMLHHVDRIVRRGRIRGFRVMLITQRPAVLHKNVLTQANTLIAMRLTAPQDRKAILAWVEGQADAGQAKAVLESLARLQRGEGWVWAPEHDLLERVQFPRIRTFDSSRAPDDAETIAEPAMLADVDLGEIKVSFAAIEEEAAANDPRKLHAEIARLKRELAAAKSDTGIPASEVKQRVAAAVAEALKHSSSVVNNSRNILSDVSRKALLKIGEIAAKTLATESLNSVEHLTKPAEMTGTLKPSASVARQAPLKVGSKTGSSVATGITAPQQRILDVLAQLALYGIEAPAKEMVAAHAGVSPTSGGYFNNLGRLRASGLVDYPQPGAVALSDAGRAAANHPDRAPTLDELHESWFAILPAPQAVILRAAVAAYPRAIPKDDLADEVGVSRTSGGYFNNLGRLRTLGAIDYPQKGTVRASDILFPKP